jgi:plastocyanin
MKSWGVMAALLLCAGCSQKKPEPQYFHVDPATAGSVHGVVRFDGKAPAAKRISMDAEEACESLHKTPVFDEPVKAAKDGGLANVFVYVKTGLEGKVFEPAKTAVMLDQHGCQFVPRVVALQTGQTLAVKNSDPVSHNIHPMPKNNRDWNQQQPPEAADLQRHFAFPEVMIPVKCNIHAWMKTYIGVLPHPYFAVTGETGEFAFASLPPGKYTVAAWHESFGEITHDVEVPPSGKAALKFEFR